MDIEIIKRRLLIKYPLFGSIVANSNFVSDASIETAGTDEKNIYFNPNFIEKITKDQQVFIFAHEVAHIAFDHIKRSEGKDKKIWNLASDAVTNALLKQDGLPIVEGGIDIKEAINYNVEEMYEKLLKEQEQQNANEKQQNNSKSQDSKEENPFQDDISTRNSDQEEQKTSQDVGHDTHAMWEKAVKEKRQNEQSQTEERKKIDEKEWFEQNRKEKKRQLEELREKLASESHGYDLDGQNERRWMEEIGTAKPLIDWRRLLKEAIKYDVDWSYQNAEIEDGVVTAHLEEMPKKETEIVLDTSGSINETLLRNFLRECKNIVQTSKVKVGCFDTAFYGFTEIRNEKDIDDLPFYGGGGTDFEVAVNAFTKRVENKIIFTDGFANMPNTKMDIIWIVFGNEKINPNGGKVIYIDETQLDRLSYSETTTNNHHKLK